MTDVDPERAAADLASAFGGDFDVIRHGHRLRGPRGRTVVISDLVVLGGCGFEFTIGQPVVMTFDDEGLKVVSTDTDSVSETRAFSEIIEIEVTGPGMLVKSAGFIGGGFGLRGAAEGMLIAGLLNALTTRSEVQTFIRIAVDHGELFLHQRTLDPFPLRIALSPVLTRLRMRDDT
jgi:hypothetical protein